jgi:hypothetical protein
VEVRVGLLWSLVSLSSLFFSFSFGFSSWRLLHQGVASETSEMKCVVGGDVINIQEVLLRNIISCINTDEINKVEELYSDTILISYIKEKQKQKISLGHHHDMNTIKLLINKGININHRNVNQVGAINLVVEYKLKEEIFNLFNK